MAASRNGFSLVYREQKKGADLVAKLAHSLPSRTEFFRVSDLHSEIRKCLFIDRIGIPVFRPPCK